MGRSGACGPDSLFKTSTQLSLPPSHPPAMPEAGAAKAKQRQRKLRRAAGAAEGEGGDDSSRRVTRAQILASHLQRLLAAGWGLVVVTLLGPATSLQRNYLRRHMLPPLAGLLVLLFAAVLAGTAQTASGLEDLVGVGAGGVLPRCGAADASGRLPGGSSLGLLLQLLAGPASACRLSDFPLTEVGSLGEGRGVASLLFLFCAAARPSRFGPRLHRGGEGWEEKRVLSLCILVLASPPIGSLAPPSFFTDPGETGPHPAAAAAACAHAGGLAGRACDGHSAGACGRATGRAFT